LFRVIFFDLDDTQFDRTAALRSLDAEALAWVIELDDRGRRPRPHFAAAVIVTNGGAAQRDKLQRAGLADVVEQVVVSGELGIAKPAPGIFERALAWSEAAPGACLFVGDDPIDSLERYA